MDRSTSIRAAHPRLWACVAASTAILTMVTVAPAVADVAMPDADAIFPGPTNVVGVWVAPGETFVVPVSFELQCGWPYHLDAGQTATLAFDPLPSFAPPGGSIIGVTPATIEAPESWPADQDPWGGDPSNCPAPPDDVLQDAGDSFISLTAPSIPGVWGFLVAYGSSLSPAGANDSESVLITSPVFIRVYVEPPSDTTAPVITPSVTPPSPDGFNGWYTNEVTVSWTVEDPESAITWMSGCDTTLIDSDTGGTTLTCSATSSGGTASESVTIMRDAAAPVIVDDGPASGPDGAGGWYITPVTNGFSASDPTPGSGLAGPSTWAVSSGLTEGNAVAISSGAVTDIAGNANPGILSTPSKIDLSEPTVSCGAASSFILSQPGAVVTATVADAISGPSSATTSAAADTSAVGTFYAPVTGHDQAGWSTTVSCPYTVGYRFSGFFQPIDNDSVNSAKAGQAIPVKWRLTDFEGVGVSDPTSFKNLSSVAGSGACTGLPTDAIEEYTGSSGLQYLGDGYWQFNWKTPKPYAGQCRTMKLHLNDGSPAGAAYDTAAFSFK